MSRALLLFLGCFWLFWFGRGGAFDGVEGVLEVAEQDPGRRKSPVLHGHRSVLGHISELDSFVFFVKWG